MNKCVLFFTDSLRAGGKERQLAELIKGIRTQNFCRCVIVTMSGDNHYFDGSDVEIHYLIRKNQKDPSVFFRFYSIIKTIKPDIIHTWDPMTSIYAVPAAKLLNVKLVTGMIRDAPPNLHMTDKRLFWSRLSFPFSDAVVGNSQAGLKAYGAPLNKSRCIYNGFDFSRLATPTSQSGSKILHDIGTNYIVGMVASFSENKDYLSFIKAAELVLKQKSGVTFVAVGEGTNSLKFENLIPHHLRKSFQLLGKQHDVESIVSQFEIGILSTSDRHGEGISNAITEYMASGKPVIATDAGGTNELVIDGVTGYLIKRSDYQSMADKIVYLKNNPEIARSMGELGRQRIINSLSMPKMINEYCSLYTEILG